jgi:hypothetical protein
MKRTSLTFAAVIIAVLNMGPAAYAQSDNQSKAPLPKGYEGLFRDISTAMNKYPGAAARFTINDTKPDQPAGAHHACCKYGCDVPNLTDPGCGCIEQCQR